VKDSPALTPVGCRRVSGDGGGGLEGGRPWGGGPAEVADREGRGSEAAFAPPATGGGGRRLGQRRRRGHS
jgi:hypothetical protein